MKVFENSQFGKVRVVTREGEPWFVGYDVASILGYSAPRNAIKTHVDDEDKTTALIQCAGSNYKSTTNLINESGVYSLILSSKLEGAKAFKHWVTYDVIPSIRRHGVYAVDEVLNNPDMLIGALQALKAERAEKEALLQANNHQAVQIEALQPKADYCDKVLQAPDSMPITLIAKEYGMTAYQLNKMLSDMKVQYKTGGVWTLYKEYQGEGYTKMHTYCDCYGRARNQTQWTRKGRKFLYTLLQNRGVQKKEEKAV